MKLKGADRKNNFPEIIEFRYICYLLILFILSFAAVIRVFVES